MHHIDSQLISLVSKDVSEIEPDRPFQIIVFRDVLLQPESVRSYRINFSACCENRDK
jgi:hypothetical protein